MTGAAGAFPPRHAALQHAQAIGQAIGQAIALAILAIRFRVAKIANDCIGILVIAKRIAPCARLGGAGVEGGKAWVMAWVVRGS
jgi:hypothetical protein